MSHLLDVSFLLACGWSTHARHAEACQWLEQQSSFAITALAELGFVRVSMTPGYRASFKDAQTVLSEMVGRAQAHRVLADLPASCLPSLRTHGEVTDAYLVELARSHSLKLATLDDALCQQSWALGIAVNPL